MLEDADLFLDRVAHEESVGVHAALLSDPVATVDRLVFHGGVPPGIVKDDVARRGKVETAAAGFQGKKEDLRLLRFLEVADDFVAVFRLAGEVAVGPLAVFEFLLDDVEHGDELREDEHLVAFLVELIEQVEEGVELGALLVAVFRVDETGVTADLPQTHEALEDDEAVLAEAFVVLDPEKDLLDALEFGAVELLLGVLHFAEDVLLDLGWQVEGDFALGAAQEEGTEAGGEARLGMAVLPLVEIVAEVFPVAEDAGHREAHEAPDVEETVFDRRPGEDEAVAAGKGPRRLGRLGVGILDLLAFVEDHAEPVDPLQLVRAGAELAVVQHEEVDVFPEAIDLELDLVAQHLHAD